MRRKINPLKLSAIVSLMMLCMPILANAQTDPVVAYLCGSVSVTLTPNFGTSGYSLQPADDVIWNEFDESGNSIQTINKKGEDPKLVLSGLSVGKHIYKVNIVPDDNTSCAPDVSDEYTVYMLPASTVELNSSLNAYCTAGENNIDPAVLTATAITAGSVALPMGVDYTYAWGATKGGSSINLSEIGTIDNNKFTMTTHDVGTYEFTVTAAYSVPTDAFFRSEDGNHCQITDNASVEVTARPTKPTVTFE